MNENFIKLLRKFIKYLSVLDRAIVKVFSDVSPLMIINFEIQLLKAKITCLVCIKEKIPKIFIVYS